MRRRSLAAIIAALAVAACGLPTIDKAADAQAKALYEQIRTGADLSQNPDLGPDLRKPAALAQLTAIKAMLPPGVPTSVVNPAWDLKAGTGGVSATLVHAYRYPDVTVLAQTVLAKTKSDVWQIVGFRVTLQSSGRHAPAGAVTNDKSNQTT